MRGRGGGPSFSFLSGGPRKKEEMREGEGCGKGSASSPPLIAEGGGPSDGRQGAYRRQQAASGGIRRRQAATGDGLPIPR